MRKRFRVAILAALLLSVWVTALPATAGADPVAVVNSTSSSHTLDLRTAPKKDAGSLGQYYNGVIVTIKDKNSTEWWKVDIYGRTGYMDARFLMPCGLQGSYDQSVIDSVKSAKPKATVGGQRATDGLHLRNRPSTTASSRGKFYNGTPVEIMGTVENGSWYHVYLPELDLVGFMLSKYVMVNAGPGTGTPESPEDNPQASSGIYAVVNNPLATDRLNLRTSKSETAKSLGKYYNGTTVEVLDHGDTWCRVRIDGKTGYMLTKYLVLDSSIKTLVKLDVGRNDISGPPYPTLRSAPSDSASAVSLPDPKLGGSLTILGKAGTWYYVEAQGIKGYYPANKVMPGAKTSTQKKIAVVTGPNLSDRLNLRSSASKTASILGKFFVGTQVEVLDDNATDATARKDIWYQVKVNGKKGYMQAIYLQDVQTGDPSTW